MGSTIYFAANYFFIFHHRPFIFSAIMVGTLALGIYAFYHTPELFKCEALLVMP